MKIIKPGVLKQPKPTLLRGTCSACDCVVECESQEAHAVVGSRPFFTLKCPTAGCGVGIVMTPWLTRSSPE